MGPGPFCRLRLKLSFLSHWLFFSASEVVLRPRLRILHILQWWWCSWGYYILSLSRSHSHTCSISHIVSLLNTHTHTQTHTSTRSLSLCLHRRKRLYRHTETETQTHTDTQKHKQKHRHKRHTQTHPQLYTDTQRHNHRNIHAHTHWDIKNRVTLFPSLALASFSSSLFIDRRDEFEFDFIEHARHLRS